MIFIPYENHCLKIEKNTVLKSVEESESNDESSHDGESDSDIKSKNSGSANEFSNEESESDEQMPKEELEGAVDEKKIENMNGHSIFLRNRHFSPWIYPERSKSHSYPICS